MEWPIVLYIFTNKKELFINLLSIIVKMFHIRAMKSILTYLYQYSSCFITYCSYFFNCLLTDYWFVWFFIFFSRLHIWMTVISNWWCTGWVRAPMLSSAWQGTPVLKIKEAPLHQLCSYHMTMARTLPTRRTASGWVMHLTVDTHSWINSLIIQNIRNL